MAINTVASDTFTDTTGTRLNAHTMDIGGVGWTERSDVWKIASNKAKLDSGSGGIMTTPSGATNFVATVDLHTAASGSVSGMIFNYVDSSNFWMLWAHIGGNWELYSNVSGSFVLQASDLTGFTPAADTTYALKLYVYDDQIAFYVDGRFSLRYNASSRPLKSNQNVGVFANETNSTFDNFVVLDGYMPASIKELSWKLVNHQQKHISLFDDHTIWLGDFSSDTSASYSAATNISGATTFTVGSGTAVASGAGAGHKLFAPTATGLTPTCYALLTVSALSSTTTVTPEVGFYKDSSNYILAKVSSGALIIDQKIGGTQTTSSSLVTGLTPPYTIVVCPCHPEVMAWYDSGSGFTAAGYQNLTPSATEQPTTDIRLFTDFAAAWHPFFGFDRAAGETGTASAFKAGYFGGNLANYKNLHYANREPYIAGGKAYWTATVPGLHKFTASHVVIVSVDLSTYTVAIEGHLFFNINGSDITSKTGQDRCVALTGLGACYDTRDSKWKMINMTTGWDTISVLQMAYSETTTDITSGVHAIDAYEVAVPGALDQVYDGTMYLTDTGPRIIEVNRHTTRIPTIYSGPDIDNLTEEDTSAIDQESLDIAQVGGEMYFTCSPSGAWDHTFNDGTFLSSAIAERDSPTDPSSVANLSIIPYALNGTETRYMWLVWKNDEFEPGGDLYAFGPAYVYISDQIQKGLETFPTLASSGGGGAVNYYAQMRRLN